MIQLNTCSQYILFTTSLLKKKSISLQMIKELITLKDKYLIQH